MDYTLSLIAFLGGGSLLSVALVNLFKKTVNDAVGKYGKLTTLTLLLVISFIVSLIGYGVQFLPVNFVVALSSIFGGAIFVYEFIYKTIWQGIDA